MHKSFFPKKTQLIALSLITCSSLWACSDDGANSTSVSEQPEAATLEQSQKTVNQWRPIFNGNDLSGWTPKFAKAEYGENYKNTFAVKDGKLVVQYDQYTEFDDRFGHLYYQTLQK